MNRRQFLAATASAVGALALDPERLLWVPGKTSYFDIRPNCVVPAQWGSAESVIGGAAGGGKSAHIFCSKALFYQIGGTDEDLAHGAALADAYGWPS